MKKPASRSNVSATEALKAVLRASLRAEAKARLRGPASGAIITNSRARQIVRPGGGIVKPGRIIRPPLVITPSKTAVVAASKLWSHMKRQADGHFISAGLDLPPPPPPPSFFAHEPAGYTRVMDNDMSSATYDDGGPNAQLITNATGGYSPPSRIRANYHTNDTPDTNPDGDVFLSAPDYPEFQFTARRKLYASWLGFWPLNWQYNDGGGTKLGPWIGITGEPAGNPGQAFYMLAKDASPHWLRLIQQEVKGQGWELDPDLVTVSLTLGQINEIEVHLIGNSSGGASDGTVQMWLNGTQWYFNNAVNFNTGAAGTFYCIRWEPFWGGSSGTFTHDTYCECDHIRVSTSN